MERDAMRTINSSGIRTFRWAFATVLAEFLSATTGSASADDPKPKDAAPTRDEMFKKFSEQMSGVKLVGRFTVLGKEDGKLTAEEYRILSVKKMDEGDYWL